MFVQNLTDGSVKFMDENVARSEARYTLIKYKGDKPDDKIPSNVRILSEEEGKHLAEASHQECAKALKAWDGQEGTSALVKLYHKPDVKPPKLGMENKSGEQRESEEQPVEVEMLKKKKKNG